MPYIKPEDRERAELTPKTLGELNYAITRMCLRYAGPQLSYDKIAGLTGVLENVKQEFYRRAASPYEDLKREENGDVY